MRSEQTHPANRELNDYLETEVLSRAEKLRFPVYLSDILEKTDINELELSVRSTNCLRRAGFQTIGDLVNGISGSEDLKHIRNCGARSVSEIMTRLLEYQYSMLSPARQNDYLKRVCYLSMLSREAFEKLQEGGAK